MDDRHARKGSITLEKRTSLNSLGVPSNQAASLNESQQTLNNAPKDGATEDAPTAAEPATTPHPKMAEAISTARSIPKQPGPEKAKTFNASVGTATAAARNWGLNVLQGKTPIIPGTSSSSSSVSATQQQQQQQPEMKRHQRERSISSSPAQPMGRGQPLPPPGQPLPKPEKGGWSAGAVVSSLRRKPVGVGGVGNNGTNSSHSEAEAMARARSASGRSGKQPTSKSDPVEDLVMRIDAPQDSGASTPIEEKRDDPIGSAGERDTSMLRSASAQGLETLAPGIERTGEEKGESDVEKLKKSESVPERMVEENTVKNPETAQQRNEGTEANRFTSSSGDIT